MRGKDFLQGLHRFRDGITPAYAGKSNKKWRRKNPRQDHPRVCGEKRGCVGVAGALYGSPPRMRGKGQVPAAITARQGITPAYAGKSDWRDHRPYHRQDHPRVCGEKGRFQRQLQHGRGSPPRMRGKVPDKSAQVSRKGITPAYAGKRQVINFIGALYKDHPRVCGEKTKKIP